MYFRACRRAVFRIFPKLHSIMRSALPRYLLERLWIVLQYSAEAKQLKYTASKMGLFVTKNGK